MTDDNPFQSPIGGVEEIDKERCSPWLSFRARITVLLSLLFVELLFIVAGIVSIIIASPSRPRQAGANPANFQAAAFLLVVGVVFLFTVGVGVAVLLDRNATWRIAPHSSPLPSGVREEDLASNARSRTGKGGLASWVLVDLLSDAFE